MIDIEILRIGQVLKGLDRFALRGSTMPQDDPDGRDRFIRWMRAYDEVRRATATYWALPRPVRNWQMVTYQVPVPVPSTPTSTKQSIYIIIDASGSMAQRRRINIALGVLRNRLTAVLQERAQVRFAMFDTRLMDERLALDPEGARACWSALAERNFTGGGTNIGACAAEALRRVLAMDGIRPEVVIVTDGEDGKLDSAAIASMAGKFKAAGVACHTFQVDGRESGAIRLAEATGGAGIRHIRTREVEAAQYDEDFAKLAHEVRTKFQPQSRPVAAR